MRIAVVLETREKMRWLHTVNGFIDTAFNSAFAQEMLTNAVVEIIGGHDTRIWRVLSHYIPEFSVRKVSPI